MSYVPGLAPRRTHQPQKGQDAVVADLVPSSWEPHWRCSGIEGGGYWVGNGIKEIYLRKFGFSLHTLREESIVLSRQVQVQQRPQQMRHPN